MFLYQNIVSIYLYIYIYCKYIVPVRKYSFGNASCDPKIPRGESYPSDFYLDHFRNTSLMDWIKNGPNLPLKATCNNNAITIDNHQ
jgi:hypothetical protein